MDKFGVETDDLISGLRDEEHTLMLKVMQQMNGMEKTAEEAEQLKRAEARLHQVRAKISEHDLKKTDDKQVQGI